jgi:DNA-binding XRE family transcriptional regulator
MCSICKGGSDLMSKRGSGRNEYVRQVRRCLSLTQEEFAALLYVARETIARYETGAPVSDRSIAQMRDLVARQTAPDAIEAW